MNKQQLEITLRTKPCRRINTRRRRQVSRARWWFNQMRRVVDEAIEWRPAPVAHPEQIHLSMNQ